MRIPHYAKCCRSENVYILGGIWGGVFKVGCSQNTGFSSSFVLRFANFISSATANATCLWGIGELQLVLVLALALAGKVWCCVANKRRTSNQHRHRQWHYYGAHKDVVLPRDALPAFELVPFEMMTCSLHKQIFLKTTASVRRLPPVKPTLQPHAQSPTHISQSIHLPLAVVAAAAADVAAVMAKCWQIVMPHRTCFWLGLCWFRPRVADRLCQAELISRWSRIDWKTFRLSFNSPQLRDNGKSFSSDNE